ncbi:unnamed protein product [Didymodactylos carnosus]|uniref:JmjC domain-containing protein n=1 Tax=Didymodactylos carnosus TaxID=1234261 RepID=A0A8S2E476_9BILA|nr:unnamed protein product [Didymodactylos carnosus]CAF3892092.1 unnamed protein product [Didymodactylos carnosus]
MIFSGIVAKIVILDKENKAVYDFKTTADHLVENDNSRNPRFWPDDAKIILQYIAQVFCDMVSYEENIINIYKKSNKTFFGCKHIKSFRLAEYIPWTVLDKLRADCQQHIKITYRSITDFIQNLIDIREVQVENIPPIFQDKVDKKKIEYYCDNRLPVFNESESHDVKKFFHKYWSIGMPILVKRAHRGLSKKLWLPESFKQEMLRMNDLPLLHDCQTSQYFRSTKETLEQFWNGFQNSKTRIKNGNKPMILKLKDFPTKKDFATVFPERLNDVMNNIPFGEYTRRSYTFEEQTKPGGQLNIVECLPSMIPDLGPKLYIAYSGREDGGTSECGTTNLHIDVSDAVNILVHVNVMEENERNEVRNFLNSSHIDVEQLQRLDAGEIAGALWTIFRAEDVPKIRKYINGVRLQDLNHAVRRNYKGDPIHDQQTYLESSDVDSLEKLGVIPYQIVQFLGDALFIPSRAPHQILWRK